MKAGYGVTTEGEVALVAATLKYILGVRGHANFGVDLCEFSISFDGVSASAEPVPVELCYVTFATNPPGTASTSVTVDQMYGRVTTAGFTAAKNWTTVPTVVTVLREWNISPYGGLFVYPFSELRRPDSAPNEGFALRATAGANVNVLAEMSFERC